MGTSLRSIDFVLKLLTKMSIFHMGENELYLIHIAYKYTYSLQVLIDYNR